MNKQDITGIILAGGQGRRMNYADKGLVLFAGKPLYQHVLERFKPQVGEMAISANRNQAIYKKSGYSVISDTLQGYQGPLAGMLAGLQQSKTDWVCFVPCDMPFIPATLVEALMENIGERVIAYAHDEYRAFPTLALVHVKVAPALEAYLASDQRRLLTFFEQQGAVIVNFFGQEYSFRNINTLDECQ